MTFLNNFKFAAILTIVVFGFTSCSSDDDGGIIIDDNVIAPDNYSFERNDVTSVSYSGQTDRIMMGNELASALKTSTNTATDLSDIFTNTNNPFSDPELNDSGKDIRSKTAASEDYFSSNTTGANAIKTQFDNWLNSQATEVFPVWESNASPGFAGKITESNGTTERRVNAFGIEYDQGIIKGLIGALTADQMLNNYLSPAVLDAGDNRSENDNDVLATDKNYTTMEHKWDEAFGYLYGVDDALNPTLGAQGDQFLNKYLKRVNDDEDFNGIADDVYNAFKLGRAAIVAKNYTVRDQQAEIIREKISMVIGVRAVYYLQQAKNVIAEPKDAFHDLSEGYGFIYSLQFTRKPNSNQPYFSASEVEDLLDALLGDGDNGFWDVTAGTLDDISNSIANRFSFSVEEAAN